LPDYALTFDLRQRLPIPLRVRPDLSFPTPSIPRSPKWPGSPIAHKSPLARPAFLLKHP